MAIYNFSETEDLLKIKIGDTLMVDVDNIVEYSPSGGDVLHRYGGECFLYLLYKRIATHAENIGCINVEMYGHCKSFTFF
jgi:GGDEF domain-containing protein